MYICVLGIFINVYFCIFALSYFFQLGLRALADSGDVSVEAGLRVVRQHWRQLILPRRRSTMPGLPPPPFIFQLKVYCPSCLLGLIFKVEVFLLFPLFSYGLSIKLKVGSTSFPRILTHLGEEKKIQNCFPVKRNDINSNCSSSHNADFQLYLRIWFGDLCLPPESWLPRRDLPKAKYIFCATTIHQPQKVERDLKVKKKVGPSSIPHANF